MNIYKKIVIALIIIIFSYIFWRLISKRNQLKKNTEPFSFNIIPDSASSDLNKLKDTIIKIDMNSLPEVYHSLPLMDFCIKGSYNSAFTGKYINIDMLTYELSRGCRFFDFEVFFIENPESRIFSPQVAYSTDTNFSTMDCENSILLDNILSALVSNAFSTQNSPNSKDPLFINLRIKSNNSKVYKAVASSIDFTIKNMLYKGKVTKNTPMKDLMGKIVLCIDKTINYNYRDYTNCDKTDKACYDLKNYTNIESGGENMVLSRYTNTLNEKNVKLMIKDNNLNTNVQTMNLVLPDTIPDNAPNPNIQQFLIDHGSQIVPFKFYKKDEGLYKYEEFFNDTKGGIVPMSVAIIYYKKKNQ
jgi:hypothetical protein